MSFFDFKYDGSCARFYNSNKELIGEKNNIKMRMMSESNYKLLDIKPLISLFDAENKYVVFIVHDGLSEEEKSLFESYSVPCERSYSFFLRKSSSNLTGIYPETDWKPIYFCSENPKDITEGQFLICESNKIAKKLQTNMFVLPLLETILHIHQEYFCCTLEQIAVRINGSYTDDFYDKEKLMKFLFEHFRREFREICINEAISIQEIHSSVFNYTFMHAKDASIYCDDKYRSCLNGIKEINEICYLYPTSVGIQSGTIQKKSYGNIFAIINRPNLQKEFIYDFGPLSVVRSFDREFQSAFRENKNTYEKFIALSFFNNIKIGDKKYPPFYMGFRFDTDDRFSFCFRGEIFRDFSLREEMILTEIYRSKFIKNIEIPSNYEKFFADYKFKDSQKTVRGDILSHLNSLIAKKEEKN